MSDKTTCDICLDEDCKENVKHLPIYVKGSEGVVLCSACQVALSNHLSAMRSAAARAHRKGVIANLKKPEPDVIDEPKI